MMFDEMRLKSQQLSEEETIALLDAGEYGVLSTIGANGYPYGVPINYIYDDGKIYICLLYTSWKGIQNGAIATIATDHCPFRQSEKDWGITKKDGTPGDFTTIPNGCAGVENMYPYMLSQAVAGRLSFNRVVELCAANPARLFGISRRKGAVQAGLDADLVIYDPEKEFTITNDAMHGDTDHTIWEGVKLKGYPEATYSRGKLVFKDGTFLGKRGDGRRLKCEALSFTGPVL